MTIRVLLADDHQLIREGLRVLLEAEPDMAVAAEAEDGREAVRLAGRVAPCVVLLDVAMPSLNGIEAARQIRESAPSAKTIGLSMHAEPRFVSEMLVAGAAGYLLKDCARDELARAIRAVHAGRHYLCPHITRTVVDAYVRQAGASRASARTVLSDREREVLQLIAEGQPTKQIAHDLHVSVKTVETHRTHVMHKLDLHSVAELTKFAVREGLTSP